MTFKFELTDAGGTDYAIKTISMDGTDIIVYFRGDYEFDGVRVNGGELHETEDGVKGLLVRMGIKGFVYDLYLITDIIAKASKQIEDIVIEAREAEEREEEAYDKWVAGERQIYQKSVL